MHAELSGSQVLFVRHCESVANVDHRFAGRFCSGLTDRGCAQASELAERLLSFRPTRILSSPLPRAVQTAAIVAAKAGLRLELSDLLTELDVGGLEGRTDDQAWTSYRRIKQAWRAGDHALSFEGGESLERLRERLTRFVEDLLETSRRDDVTVVVSHGDILQFGLPVILGNVREETTSVWIDNAAFVHSVREDDRLVCVEWGGVPVDKG